MAADDAQLAGIFNAWAGAFSSPSLTELAHGSNLAASETTAERDGDAHAVRRAGPINGGRSTRRSRAGAHDRGEGRGAAVGGARGDPLLLLVERDGAEALPRWRTLPMRAADIAGVRFRGTRVPVGAALGGEGNGLASCRRRYDLARGDRRAGVGGGERGVRDRAGARASGRV